MADDDHCRACGGIVGGDFGAGFGGYKDADFGFFFQRLDSCEGVFFGVTMFYSPLPEGAHDFEGVVIGPVAVALFLAVIHVAYRCGAEECATAEGGKPIILTPAEEEGGDRTVLGERGWAAPFGIFGRKELFAELREGSVQAAVFCLVQWRPTAFEFGVEGVGNLLCCNFLFGLGFVAFD